MVIIIGNTSEGSAADTQLLLSLKDQVANISDTQQQEHCFFNTSFNLT